MGVEAVLYTGANYSGSHQAYGRGMHRVTSNRRTSSVRVPEGCRVTLFEHSETARRRLVFDEDCPFLPPAMDDTTSNVLVEVLELQEVSGVAQYGGADWSNEVHRMSGATLEEAKAYAESNPEVSFFFFMTGSMALSAGPGWSAKGQFNPGDAVFFSGVPWYGSAVGRADAYEKRWSS